MSGGTTSDDWGVLRWLNSRVAILLSRPLTNIEDPMAGFFALRRSTFDRAADANPIGYKIGLELIVRCRCERVVEIPIHFEDRQYGRSKLGFKQQLLYLEHLRRLYLVKYGTWNPTLQFLFVGGMGTLVNVAALTLLLQLRLAQEAAVAIASSAPCVNSKPTGACFPGAGSGMASVLRFRPVDWSAMNHGTLVTMNRAPGMRPQLAAPAASRRHLLQFLASRYSRSGLRACDREPTACVGPSVSDPALRVRDGGHAAQPRVGGGGLRIRGVQPVRASSMFVNTAHGERRQIPEAGALAAHLEELRVGQ